MRGLASNISQRATTPTSAALSGRKRSEPSRAATSNPLSAEPAVSIAVGGEGPSAYAGIVGDTSSAGGRADSVAADWACCDKSVATDIDAGASFVTAAVAVGSGDSDPVSAARPVGVSTCRNRAGEAGML